MENELLEQIKDQFAKDREYDSWKDYRENRLEKLGPIAVDCVSNIIAMDYAKEFAKAELEKVKTEIGRFTFLSDHRYDPKTIEKAQDLINKRIEEI